MGTVECASQLCITMRESEAGASVSWLLHER